MSRAIVQVHAPGVQVRQSLIFAWQGAVQSLIPQHYDQRSDVRRRARHQHGAQRGAQALAAEKPAQIPEGVAGVAIGVFFRVCAAHGVSLLVDFVAPAALEGPDEGRAGHGVDLERGAANALLKILEEPPADVLFLLVAQAARTVKSPAPASLPPQALDYMGAILRKQGFSLTEALKDLERVDAEGSSSDYMRQRRIRREDRFSCESGREFRESLEDDPDFEDPLGEIMPRDCMAAPVN